MARIGEERVIRRRVRCERSDGYSSVASSCRAWVTVEASVSTELTERMRSRWRR